MQPVNLGRVDAQRAIDKDRHTWHLAGQCQLVQRVDNLLSTSDGKRRDNDFAVFLKRFPNQLSNLFVCSWPGRVIAAAVSALHLKIVDLINGNRIAQDVILTAPDVAAKQESKLASIFFD